MKELNLSGRENIADLGPLKGMKTLEKIWLHDTKFEKMSLREIVGE